MNRFSFFTLDEMHEELDQLFLFHQEALLVPDISAAGAQLDRFERRLRLHMQQEEEQLIPAYSELGLRQGVLRQKDIDIYLLEHRKLISLLTRIRHELDHLAVSGDPSPAQIISLLDREATFKRVVEHHNMRERTQLYARLEEWVPPRQRCRIVQRCIREWTGKETE